MVEDREEEDRGFKVHDRRRFADTGDQRESAQERPEESAPCSDPQASEEVPPEATHTGGEAPPAEINFAMFTISLSTQALAHLGEIPDPASGSTQIDLLAARQLIDIIGMLQEKTRGNLDDDESALIEHALYDLRMKYIECAKKP